MDESTAQLRLDYKLFAAQLRLDYKLFAAQLRLNQEYPQDYLEWHILMYIVIINKLEELTTR